MEKTYEVTMTVVVHGENEEEAAHGFTEYVYDLIQRLEDIPVDSLEIKEIEG